MSMNNILKIILLTLFLLIVDLFPQEKDIDYSSDGFIYTLNIVNESFKIEGHQKRIIDFYNAVDESNPGSPALPSKSLLLHYRLTVRSRYN